MTRSVFEFFSKHWFAWNTQQPHLQKCDETGAIETLNHLNCNCPPLSRARRRYLSAPLLAFFLPSPKTPRSLWT